MIPKNCSNLGRWRTLQNRLQAVAIACEEHIVIENFLPSPERDATANGSLMTNVHQKATFAETTIARSETIF
jgi:hypothetical protein